MSETDLLELRTLVQVLKNAAFDCGEFDMETGDYSTVLREAEKAERELIAWVKRPDQRSPIRSNALLGGGGVRVNMETKEAFEALKKAIQEDHSYAWSWHCNVAMPFQDEGGSHEQANRAAAKFMQTAFDVDVTTFDEWSSFPWANKTAAERPR